MRRSRYRSTFPPRRAWSNVSHAFLWLLLLSPLAHAHHILGIPHYAYDEMYPQAPVLTYLIDAGPHQIKMTGYPGKPKPGEQCTLHVYIQRRDNNQPFDGQVTFTALRDRLLGADPVIYGPITAQREQAVYKFYPQFQSEANYLARIQFQAEGAPWIIDLPIVVGEPGSPWLLLGCVALGLILFLIVVRAIRIKMRRRSDPLPHGD